MDYSNLYFVIIEQATKENRLKKRGTYFENHHIKPLCLGGLDDTENLVLLTAREHYICHKLLTKIYPNEIKVHYAFYMMSMTSPNQQRYNTDCQSRAYEESRKEISAYLSNKWTNDNPNNYRDLTGKNNPMYGSCRTGKDNPFYGKRHTEETKNKISKANKGFKWTNEQKQKLRDLWIDKPKIKCPHCAMTSIHESNMRRYHFDNCKFRSQ